MNLPVIQGVIRRRILVNFRVDPDVMQRQLPAPFRPKLLGDSAVAGICLIRLEQLRPRLTPAIVGMASENAAHRVAVAWTDPAGQLREGVYIPRRDSDSVVNRLIGGRFFPGEHHPARFDVDDRDVAIAYAMESDDGTATVRIRARPAESMPSTSHFVSVEEASTFFAEGATGYSPRRHGTALEGLHLQTAFWHVEPLEIDEVSSSYFADSRAFPPGSVEFDCALLMRNIPSEWRTVPELLTGEPNLTLAL